MKASLGALSLMALLGCQTPEPSAAGASEAASPLVTGPDFVVTELSTPASVLPGNAFEVSATVCNQGGQGGATQAALYLSADTVLSVQADYPGGQIYLPYLQPGQCSRQTTMVSAHVPSDGVWYVGARLDPLGDENPGNNTRFSAPVGIGYQADFVITSVKGPASVRPDELFTAQATVCNQGTRTESTQVLLYLTEGAYMGDALVYPLAPNQCTTVSISGRVHAPSTTPPGVRAFHLGARVDPGNTTPELSENNNTHPGYVLGVGDAPDFVITSVKGPASVDSGQQLTAQVTVCNQGTRPYDTRVLLVLSQDEHIRLPSPSTPPEDQIVGDRPVPPLAPGQCTTVSIPSSSIYPPPMSTPEARSFHLGAVLDPYASPGELRTDNNTNPGYLLGVGNAPDFVITSVKGPASVDYGQQLTAQVTVCNQGTRPSDTRVLLVLSQDEQLRLPSPSAPSEDQLVGDRQVPPLAPGQCTTVSIPSSSIYPPPTSPPDARSFHLGAVVDPYSPNELIEDNNTHPGYVLGVGNAPDFVVTSVKGPASVDFGQQLTAQVTVCNQGTRARDTSVALVLSEDEHFRVPSPYGAPEDVIVNGTSVPPLAPGQCTTVSISGNIYPPPSSTPDTRSFHLGAMLNPNDPNELRTDNNTHPGYVLGVGDAPDFVVTSVKGPASVDFGQQLTAQVTVCNQGTRARDTSVALVLSEDEHFRVPSPYGGPPEDVIVNGTSVPPLAPGQCTTVSISGNIYPPPSSTPDTRSFHLGAVVDPNAPPNELIEDNNTHPGYLLGVGYAPDFVITSVKGPASVDFGQQLTAQVTVCNQGTRGDSTQVALILSEDEQLRLPSPSSPSSPPEDQLVGNAHMPPLAPGQCATVSIPSSSIYPPPMSTPDARAFHLGARVDPYAAPGELRTDNNTHPGYVLGVGNAPDFVITSVKGPASVDSGQQLTAQVTVCNQGTRSDSTHVFLALSEDERIRIPSPSSPSSPPEDQLVGDTQVPPLAPGQCTTVSIPSSSIYPPPTSPPDARSFHLGAVVDPYSPNELIEDNNTHPGYVLGVGDAPDFVITSVKGPTSVDSGQQLTAQVTVCNQGTRRDSTQVALILSEDEQLRLPSPSSPYGDQLLGNTQVPPLAPGQCTTVSISSSSIYPPPTSPPDARSFHLGAVVDPNAPPNELIEDNNTHPGYLLGVGNAPDFVITSVKGPASVDFGQQLTAQVTVCNQGTRRDSTQVALILSEDEQLRLPSPSSPYGDQLVGNTQVPPLAPNQCATVSISSSSIYPPPTSTPDTRSFHLGAVVDPNAPPNELIEDNNTHPGYLLGVGNAPDFVITSVKGPASVDYGQQLTAQVTVCNQGTRSDSAHVFLALSEDERIRIPSPSSPSSPPEDQLVGDAYVPPTAPGQCATVSISSSSIYPPPMSTPDARVFHLGAVLEPSAPDELRTDNNTHPGYLLGVGFEADFIITSVESSVFVRSGQSLATRVNVCNQGTMAASTRVSVLLSTDTTLRPSSPSAPSEDVIVGEAQTGLLQPGWCESVTITGNALPPPSTTPDTQGLAYVGAVVNLDQMNPELRVDNNTLLGGWIYIAP
ncbi:CARDB domain-containing protein [Cystobacter fuscus]|uniref:CARDB domain-containing protein n=1 Tax=Cystobacter fuscus TaxID=43 RepID=UPI0037BE375C